MAEWLTQCGIRTVAQSTGVYWIAVYDILEAAGMEVYLVNARETKNLPGRKTDVQVELIPSIALITTAAIADDVDDVAIGLRRDCGSHRIISSTCSPPQ